MLVSLKEILKVAQAKKCAIGSFNTPNLASMRAVIGAAEAQKMPVIIMHAQIHEEMNVCKMEEIAPIMLFMAEKASVPVCVHLDHGTDIAYVKRALDLGFTSVMYDGSELDREMNYANTSMVVEMAKKHGASVEAEIGFMGKREGGGAGGESIYTDPDDAKDFAEKTGIDALACAFGTAHGIYAKEPKLDFDRLKKIGQMVSVPLVMHGGSGVNPRDYMKSIELGIRKINCYTYMAKAGGAEVSALKKEMLYHDIELAATKAMMEDAKKSIGFFSMPQSPEFEKYTCENAPDVKEIVKRVIQAIENN
ncbi:MAG: class II fructose-bisphosphate aldolase [Clostridia bacterium]|nr:class II fructose-bisphosphate aldolase [Clostridia bacterium]